MEYYIGIDLGTTNSAISSYDGINTTIWKNSSQNDVTPSAIYIGKRNNKYYGNRAYDSAARSPDNTATKFKRLMGTNTPIKLSNVDITMTPEECSAEILKVLYGYLPEEIRLSDNTGTVITVPAVFNQMQKEATLQAANIAGLGRVALMQEPVAAVMSVMKHNSTDGLFLIYDLGGGTLDIAIAESFSGRINLLAHGGISFCGGADFDRLILDNIVKPWLIDNFSLPEDISVNSTYRKLLRLSLWAAEKSKIELSSSDEAYICLGEEEIGTCDLNGEEIYLDILLKREQVDSLINEKVRDSIDAARDTIEKAGLNIMDIQRIVFIGGPTNYKPLRDKVCFELGIPGDLEVNPMTAVSEGASIFAESIDWSTVHHIRKSDKGQLKSSDKLSLSFNYIARTSDTQTKLAIQLKNDMIIGYEIQIDSIETGWTSGRTNIENGTIFTLPLVQQGINSFSVKVFNNCGEEVSLEQTKIAITKTASTCEAIPASNSISLEVLDTVKGISELDVLIESGASLPRSGKRVYKAGEKVRAGTDDALKFILWEGEIKTPIRDNVNIGVFKISGHDFEDGVITVGSDIEVEYTMFDSGLIFISAAIPSLKLTFDSGNNLYSRTEGQIDYTNAEKEISNESQEILSRIENLEEIVSDPKLKQAKDKVIAAIEINNATADNDRRLEAKQQIDSVKQILSKVTKENIIETRQAELNENIRFFNELIRNNATAREISDFEKLSSSAQYSIDNRRSDYDEINSQIKSLIFSIMWKIDDFVVAQFNYLEEFSECHSSDKHLQNLISQGRKYVVDNDVDELRNIIRKIYMITGYDNSCNDYANIIRR